MDHMGNIITACIVAVCGGILTKLFGVSGELLFALMAVLLIDFTTGILSAYVNNVKIESSIMARKARRFVSYAIALASMSLLVWTAKELGVPVSPDHATFIFNTAFTFMFLPEMKSVFENLTKIGITIPQPIIDLLDKISITIKK